MNSTLLVDLRDVVRELIEIEQAHLVPMRCAIECGGSAAGTRAKYGDLHEYLVVSELNQARSLTLTQLMGLSKSVEAASYAGIGINAPISGAQSSR
jgi:hypothetical protein